MGNEGSKPSKGNSNFARSDTMTSTKSSRSLKSRRSNINIEKSASLDNDTVANINDLKSPTSAQFNHHSHNTPTSNTTQTTSQKPINSRRSSFKSTFSSDNNNNNNNNNHDAKSDHYDYIYDEEFNHDDHSYAFANNTSSILTMNNDNMNTLNSNTNLKLPPSMAILKPKSPILRMNSSTSINDTSIQHMSNIERQHSNVETAGNMHSNMSRRNSSNTLGSYNSKSSRNSKNSRRSSRNNNSDGDELNSTHGIPIDSFNNMHLDSAIDDDQQKLSSSSTSNSNVISRSRSHSNSNSRSHSRSSLSNRIRTPFATDESNTADYVSYHDNTTDNTDTNNNNSNGDNSNTNGEEHRLYEHNYDNTHTGTKSSSSSIHSRPHSRAHSIDESRPEISITGDGNDDIQPDSAELSKGETLESHDFRRRYNLNIEDIIQRLLDAGYSGKRTKSVCLKNSEIALICSVAREIFLSQPTLLELSAPVKIVGDVHGQYIDLIRIFSKCGFPPASNYLFLGDYVDRGKQSLETILLLLCYKIKFPENFFLLRGNHECAQITRQYGFYDECKRRTNLKTWKLFVDTFNTLPIAAIVASKIFCVHGGLSPVLNSMDEIRNIRRPTDVPDFGLLNDLLWSDPVDSPNQWEDNERGVSYCYNKVSINNFLNKFQFDLIVRAHMVVEDGYEFFNDRSLVTVFSAPNYCGEFDNWGAVMGVSEELLCSFELLDPLDSVTLKSLMKKGRIERRNAMLNYAASPSN